MCSETILEINNGKIRCIPITDISINYTRIIFYDFTGSFHVTAKEGIHSPKNQNQSE